MKPFERLDEAMNKRRLELRMTWRELAETADISYTALRAIRRGSYRPTELTAQALDRALQWAPGSVYAVLDGGEPATARVKAAPDHTREGHPGSPATTPATISALEQELELASRLMAAQVKELGLSPDEAAEAWRRAQERIRQSHETAIQPPPEALTESPRRHNAG